MFRCEQAIIIYDGMTICKIFFCGSNFRCKVYNLFVFQILLHNTCVIREGDLIVDKDQLEELVESKIEQVNNLLQQIENVIRNSGINTPVENVFLENRIKLPSKYIRKLDYFREHYKLGLFKDRELANNISYSLQYTDCLNYVLSRTTLGIDGLSVGTIWRKYAIISVTSIIEAYLAGIVEYIADKCSPCDKKRNCIKYSKIGGKNIYTLLEKINLRNHMVSYDESLKIINSIVDIDGKLYEELDELRKVRNHIHLQFIENVDGQKKVRIRDFKKNEKRYSIDEYNKAIKALYALPSLFDQVIEELRRRDNINGSKL